jgi:Skp family chaperone for outer membrane proteins
MLRKLSVIVLAVFMLGMFVAPSGYSQGGKVGYVDLRRAFYEYEKTKSFETDLNDLTEERQEERTKKIEAITKLRDEAELLSGDAKAKKQREIEPKITELQEYDRETRQKLLNKKNDMFRVVIDDIQKIVEDMGKKGKYDFILDSRNVMYGKPAFDLTEDVIKQLNKK